METQSDSIKPRRFFWTNVAFLIAQNVVSPMFAVVLVVAISRLQGAGALGRYSLAMAFYGFGEAFASLGLNLLITRQVAANPREAGRCLANTVAVAFTALSVALFIVVPALLVLVADHELRIGLMLMTVAFPASILITYGQAALLGLDHARDLVLIDLFEGIARAVVAAGVVLSGGGLVGIVLVFLVGRLLAAATYLHRLWIRGVRFTLKVEPSSFKSIAKQSVVLGAIPIVNALLIRLDLFMLGHLRGIMDVGYYNAAGRFQDAVRPIPRGYVRALYPTLSRAERFSRDALLEESRRALTLVLGSLLPVAIVLAGLAAPLTMLVYSEQFRSAISAATLFGWIIVPYGIWISLAHVLFATGNQAFDLRVNVAALCASAAANAVAIPLWGTAGAAGAALLVTTGCAGAEYWYVTKRVGELRLGWIAAKMCVAAASAYCVVGALRDMSVPASLCAGLITYVLGLKLAGVFEREQSAARSIPERLAVEAGSK